MLFPTAEEHAHGDSGILPDERSMFHRPAARRMGSRYRAGTNDGKPAVGLGSPCPADIPTRSPAWEHGGGPPV